MVWALHPCTLVAFYRLHNTTLRSKPLRKAEFVGKYK
jgi:hypothetical protein